MHFKRDISFVICNIFCESKESEKIDTSKCLQGDGISTVSPLPPGPPEQLSGVAVVIIIAVRTPGIFFISFKW